MEGFVMEQLMQLILIYEEKVKKSKEEEKESG
jgi:hypothetical protein